MGRIHRLMRFISREKISSGNQRNCIQELCEVWKVLCKYDFVHRTEWDIDFANMWMIHAEKYVLCDQVYARHKCKQISLACRPSKRNTTLSSQILCDIRGQVVDKWCNADVGHKWNNWSAGKSFIVSVGMDMYWSKREIF